MGNSAGVGNSSSVVEEVVGDPEEVAMFVPPERWGTLAPPLRRVFGRRKLCGDCLRPAIGLKLNDLRAHGHGAGAGPPENIWQAGPRLRV